MSFRIINAVTRQEDRQAKALARGRSPSGLSSISGLVLPFSSPTLPRSTSNWFTIILGRNAIGKSQLLSDIAEAFCISSGEFTTRRKSGLNISVEFSLDDSTEKLNLDPSKDNNDFNLFNYTGPTRIVSSATTPFDKFRLSRDVIRERIPIRNHELGKLEQRYFYSGLRDTNGRTNFQAFISRTIRGIFLGDRRNPIGIGKLKSVFSFLGLEPMVEIEYSVGDMSSVRDLIDAVLSPHPSLDINKLETSSSYANRLSVFLRSRDDALHKVRTALRSIDNLGRRGLLQSVEVNLDQNDDTREFLEHLFLLKDLRLLRFREMSVRRSTLDAKMSILEASSGQISIIAGILGIAAAIQDNSLVLIDEPEISLHPEWQDRYLNLLRETLSNFSGCHFVIATHSPLILSDANEIDTTVLNISNLAEGLPATSSRMGASSDELLVKEFGVAGHENLFLKQEVIKAANSIARGDMSSREFRDRILFITEHQHRLSEKSPLKIIVDDLLSALNRLGDSNA